MPNLSKALCGCLSLWLLAQPIEASENQRALKADEVSQLYQALIPLAKNGDAKSQYLVSLLLENGRGVPVDHIAAAQWLRKAAEQGDADSQAELGDRYLQGKGVEKDCLIAHEWYWKAARQGHFRAALSFALLETRMVACTLSITEEAP